LGVEGKAVVNIDRRKVAVGLIVFGFVLVVFANVYPFGIASLDGAAVPLPEEIANLPLHTASTGLEAIDEIAELHEVNFDLTGWALGSYGANGEVTLWVAESASEVAASQLLIAIQEENTGGNSPDEIIGEETEDGRVVYRLEGVGKVYYYFQSGNLVIWLAADPGLARQALDQVLAFYQQRDINTLI
jgi:hypothetical protein